MDFELTADQRAIVDAAEKLLRRHAGPKRARELADRGGYDAELARALAEAGFTDVATSTAGESGALEAALVAEAVARHAGLVDYGARALVAPAVTSERLDGPIAIARADHEGPVRYAAQARTLLVLDGEAVRVRSLQPDEARSEPSNFGFPIARVSRDGGDVIAGAGPRLRAAWDVAVACEIAGTLRAALELTVDHVKTRHQFGKPLGAFQALQHRLAECAVLSEGARWLALEAACLLDHSGRAASEASDGRGGTSECSERASAASRRPGGTEGRTKTERPFAAKAALSGGGERAELAAAHAAAAAQRIFHEAHQLHGAMGLTREHDLFLWSMRLPALWLEARA